VDAVDIHHRIPRGQRRRVVNQYERVVIRLNSIRWDRNFGKALRQQIAEREAIGVLEIRGAQLSRDLRVVDARVHRPGRSSRIAGCEHHGDAEQARNALHEFLRVRII